MNPSSAQRWYVAQTQPHGESKASVHLVRQGFEVFLPRYLKKRRHARRVEMVAAPLYPSYIFVAIELECQRWQSIRSTIGVSKIVCRGDQPAPVPEGVVEELRRQVDGNGLFRFDRRPRFNPGDKVRIVDGVFFELLGLYEGIDDRERVAVLLDLLGRKVRVLLPSDLVDAA